MIKEFIFNKYNHSHFVGFRYVSYACELLLENENIKIKTIYELVADKYSTTSSRVERAIRYYKEKANCKHLTNGEFIFNIVNEYNFNKYKQTKLEKRVEELEKQIYRIKN